MKRRPCTWLWDMIIVNERGDVLICTDGRAEKFKLGNLKEAKLSELVSGEKMKRYRIAHILQDFSELTMCAQCSDRLIYKNYDLEFFKEYLMEIGREDLIPKLEGLFQK